MRKQPLDVRHPQEALAFYWSVRAARYVRQARLCSPYPVSWRAALRDSGPNGDVKLYSFSSSIKGSKGSAQ